MANNSTAISAQLKQREAHRRIRESLLPLEAKLAVLAELGDPRVDVPYLIATKNAYDCKTYTWVCVWDQYEGRYSLATMPEPVAPGFAWRGYHKRRLSPWNDPKDPKFGPYVFSRLSWEWRNYMEEIDEPIPW